MLSRVHTIPSAGDHARDAALRCVLLAQGGNPLVVRELCAMLRRLHLHVHVAGTLEHALRASRRPTAFMIVPGGEAGSRLLWQLARRETAEGMPAPAVLALLERGDPHLVVGLMAQGAAECLVWPADIPQLALRVERLLALPRRALARERRAGELNRV